MTTITLPRATVEQALEALKNNAGEMRVEGAISILETALAQQAEPVEPVEPVAWWKQHHDGSVELNEARTFIAEDAIATGRRPLVFGDAALAQQAEPVQVAERERIAAQWDGCVIHQLDTFGPVDVGASIRAGELMEAQQDSDCLHGVEDGACKECYATEPDLSRCPQCNGPADNGFDRSFPPSPYLCTKCMAEPVEEGK